MARPSSCDCGVCDLCKRRDYARRWYRENAERVRAKVAAYRAANIEAIRERDRTRPPRTPDPIKRRARRLVNYALERGTLKRQPCEICGSREVHAHHDDYTQPLAVRWLCPAHHGQLHREVA